MKLNEVIIIVKRLYREYIKKYISKIFLAILLSVIVAGSTSAIAWLLDPAVKKIFIEQDKTYRFFYSNCYSFCFLWERYFFVFCKVVIVIVLGNRINKLFKIK